MTDFIEWLLYLFLGILQGITEPLPISSSGHLLIARTLLNIGETDVFFEVIVHFASFFAVVFLLKDKLIELIKGSAQFIFKKDQASKTSFKYVLMLLVASIPVATTGILLRSPLEKFLEGYSLIVVGLSLLVTAGFLWCLKNVMSDLGSGTFNFKNSLFIGLIQAISIVPGISRSGATIVGGAYRKINIKELFEFSFLLYLPVTFGAGLLELRSVQSMDISLINLGTAFASSLVVTYFALKWFRSLVFQGRFRGFAIYCLLVGILSIVLFLV
jgi:undecaprenyl-diphosphatase